MNHITENTLSKPKCYRNAEGHLCVRNFSAFWLPELALQRKIVGTLYIVDGSYEGTEPLDCKLAALWRGIWRIAYDTSGTSRPGLWYN